VSVPPGTPSQNSNPLPGIHNGISFTILVSFYSGLIVIAQIKSEVRGFITPVYKKTLRLDVPSNTSLVKHLR
jgi:hypothetical protein